MAATNRPDCGWEAWTTEGQEGLKSRSCSFRVEGKRLMAKYNFNYRSGLSINPHIANIVTCKTRLIRGVDPQAVERHKENIKKEGSEWTTHLCTGWFSNQMVRFVPASMEHMHRFDEWIPLLMTGQM